MINLDHAIVYDIETTPGCFSMHVIGLFSEIEMTFEISPFRDDRESLFQWMHYWQATETPMVGFNNVGFDYVVLHFIWQNPDCTIAEIYEKAMSIINDFTGRGYHTIWQSDRFAPQIDLYLIHHFNNRAKATSLKALEVNMRSENVMECPLPFDRHYTESEIRDVLIPYNRHDVKETKQFAHYSMDAIRFRIGLSETITGDCVNFNDSKIGSKILEQRLGEELCYTREYGRKEPRQTPRSSIALNDIIFPYVEFENAEFNRVLAWMRTQTLTADDVGESEAIRTKGVFSGVRATVGGIDFDFGTGGIHGSVTSQKFIADAEWGIYDIDVAALYPSIAIVNRLYPEHLGEKFIEEYAKLPIERAKHKKGTVQNAAFKLASNGTYGNSNNKYSVFYDPKFTMAITINGQLMLCMLAEWLLSVQSLQIIAINTDGITYRCRRDRQPHAKILQGIWERKTRLVLESVEYSRMWIRDVNSYVAEGVDGKLKKKGAYWFADKFPDDISNSSPPAWHKDFSAVVATKAAVAHMTQGVDIERFVYGHGDPFDFMCRAKVDRSSKLMIGDDQVQRLTRYYVAHNGGHMRKISPPVKGAKVGDYKRRNGISDFEYQSVLDSIAPGMHDERIHTKNKSRYEIREMSIESGHKVAECNHAAKFDFGNVNYEWYIDKARKLVVT